MSKDNPYQGYHAQLLEKLERLERENAALRNEIARLNGQTIWMCACGGTDCAGRKTNAALRKGITLAVKWAELGLVDYLPEYARKGFLNDWKKLEQLLTEEEEQ